MGKIKISNVITAIICAVSISTVSFYFGTSAASGASISYKSQGKIVFNNNTEDTADDVIFDASDFKTINDMVVSGKRLVGTELNRYPSVNIDLTRTIPDFGELAAAIDTLTDDATADSGKMLKDATAYAKGAKIKGTIPSKGEATYTPGRADQTITSGQYLSGVQTIKGDSGLIFSNIAEGKTIFGVTGTAVTESHIIENNKSVDISDINGTITPSNGNNAMEQVTYSVSGVDSDKIVFGKSILGVDGTAEPESHTVLSVNDITEADGTAAKVFIAGKTYKIPAQKYADNDIYISAEKSECSSENIYVDYHLDRYLCYGSSVAAANNTGSSITVSTPEAFRDKSVTVILHIRIKDDSKCAHDLEFTINDTSVDSVGTGSGDGKSADFYKMSEHISGLTTHELNSFFSYDSLPNELTFYPHENSLGTHQGILYTYSVIYLK